MMRALLLAGLLAAAPLAGACGYCVEDKMAAAYDHAVVSRALAQQHHIAFFHVDGSSPRDWRQSSACRSWSSLALRTKAASRLGKAATLAFDRRARPSCFAKGHRGKIAEKAVVDAPVGNGSPGGFQPLARGHEK
jgi:hypothetical protein